MENIPLSDILAKMPVEEMEQSLSDFLAPMMEYLPEERLRRIVPEAVRGILAQETPVIAAMAQSTPRQEGNCWAGAKRIYRFVWNERFNHHQLFKGLYRMAQQTVAEEKLEYLVIALDPVNLEKPYTKELEGVSTVHKSTPPDLKRGSPPGPRLSSHNGYGGQYDGSGDLVSQLVFLQDGRFLEREPGDPALNPHHPLGLSGPKTAFCR